MAETEPEKKESRTKKIGSYLLLGIPGALIFMSQVTVEDATTNLAGWARFFGLDRIPVWLASPGADAVINITSFTVIAAYWAMRAYQWRLSRKEYRERIDELNAALDERVAATARLKEAIDRAEVRVSALERL